MAFREISTMDVWEVLRRWHDRHSISKIAQALGYDRKTVRRYIHFAVRKGLSLDSPLPAREDVLCLLGDGRAWWLNARSPNPSGTVPGRTRDPGGRPRSTRDTQRRLRHPPNAMASGDGSATAHSSVLPSPTRSRLAAGPRPAASKSNPAQQIQIDYCRIGLWYDRSREHRRAPATPSSGRSPTAGTSTSSSSSPRIRRALPPPTPGCSSTSGVSRNASSSIT